MLTLFGDFRSGNCLKVRWLLDRLNREYRWVETDVLAGGTRSSEFLSINPAGQVPALLLPDGRVLAQSNAIIGYLAEGTAFVPADPYLRARMYEWLYWEQYSHEPYVAVVWFQRVLAMRASEEIEPRLIARAWAALDRLESALAGSDWLVGTAPTLADLALVAYTRVAPEGGFDLRGHRALTAWIPRVEAAFGIAPGRAGSCAPAVGRDRVEPDLHGSRAGSPGRRL